MDNKWNNIFSFIGWIGFVSCLVIIIFLDKCSEKPTPPFNTIEHTRTVVYDSTKRVIVSKDAPTIISIQTVSIPAQVDTAAILLSYFSVRTYSDQIQDSSIRIQIFDSVSQNKIFGRITNYRWLKPVKTIESTTLTVTLDNSGIYAGGFAEASKTRFGFGPTVTWLTKKNVMFNYGYNVLNNSHRIGTQFYIHARAHR